MVFNYRKASSAGGDWFSLLAHELRTPLTVIKGYADLLQNGDLGALNNKQRVGVQEIERANERAIRLVDALLNLSRISQGTLAVEPRPTDLIALLTAVSAEFTQEARQRRVKLAYPHARPAGVSGSLDAEIARFILRQLLRNALQYTAPGGGVEVSVEAKGGRLALVIKDSGWGMSPAELRQVGRTLWRSAEAKQRHPTGLGFGLYVVYRLVAYVGAAIKIVSRPGQGTTVRLIMPKGGMRPHRGTKTLNS
ncbi:MAG: HAMP domain-containing histidine kinase [Candidatus Magasanikbacteria bacterium]|nr:HAMP domain-containing histidine kinase [Candidatus Magasanikbacteria bacterium]